jgi:hypothetical protein
MTVAPAESQTEKVIRRRKRRWIIFGILTALVLAVPFAGLVCRNAVMARFYGFAVYGTALRFYWEEGHGWPNSLAELEAFYNQHENRECELPLEGSESRPIFRPVHTHCCGPYLVLIEAPPRHWYWGLSRYVLYAYGDEPCVRDRPAGIKGVWYWELDKLIQEDDARRQACTTGNEATTRAADDEGG